MRACLRETFASASSSSKSTSGKIPLSASQRPMFASIPVIGNSLPTLPPRSIMSLANAWPFGSFESRSPVFCAADRANVEGGAERMAFSSLDLKAVPELSLVCPLRAFELLTRESLDDLRSRAGVAGLGTLVEVVNDGGAGTGPSAMLKLTGSLSTALGG